MHILTERDYVFLMQKNTISSSQLTSSLMAFVCTKDIQSIVRTNTLFQHCIIVTMLQCKV